jgi:hypothetical protein
MKRTNRLRLTSRLELINRSPADHALLMLLTTTLGRCCRAAQLQDARQEQRSQDESDDLA